MPGAVDGVGAGEPLAVGVDAPPVLLAGVLDDVGVAEPLEVDDALPPLGVALPPLGDALDEADTLVPVDAGLDDEEPPPPIGARLAAAPPPATPAGEEAPPLKNASSSPVGVAVSFDAIPTPAATREPAPLPSVPLAVSASEREVVEAREVDEGRRAGSLKFEDAPGSRDASATPVAWVSDGAAGRSSTTSPIGV